MADAHGRSVIETNKVNVCVVVDICVFINVQGNLFTVTQLINHKDSFDKKGKERPFIY